MVYLSAEVALRETEHNRTGQSKRLYDSFVVGNWGEHRVCLKSARENVSHHHVLALAQYLHSLFYNCLKSSKFVWDVMR